MRINSFDSLLSRMNNITEARVSPYSGAHPAFRDLTSKMKAGGLSSAPLDTIKFIREVLYFLDIIDDQELQALKKAPGFSGKKSAMLATLKQKQGEINKRSDEISQRVEDTLDNFISGAGVDRGREEKYAAQAASQEISNQLKHVKAGKKMDDALSDIISDESIIVRSAVARVLGNIQKDLGEPGLDIDPEALEEVVSFSDKIDSVEKLKSFVSQISKEPGYQEIAAYLSSAIKAINISSSSNEENEEHDEDNEVETYYDPTDGTADEAEYDEVMSGSDDIEDIYKKIDEIVYSDYDQGFHYIVDDEGARPANPEIWDRYNALVKKAIEMTNGEGMAYKVDPMKYGEYSDDHKSMYGFRPRSPITYNGMIEWIEKHDYKTRQEFNKSQDSGSYGESYTAKYMSGEKRSVINEQDQPKLETFKDKYKPKNIHQLVELSNYGFR